MGKNQLKSVVGWLVIIGHLLVFLFIVIGKDSEWNLDRKINAILTLAPVFTAYVVSVVQSFIGEQCTFDRGPVVNINFIAVSILFPVTLFAIIGYTLYSFPSQEFDRPEQLQRWLSAIEVGFGGTVGLIVEDLFPRSQRS